MKHNQRLFVVDGIDTAAECVATGPTMEVRLPCRYVSGYFPVAGPHRDDMAARFLGDVVKSTSAAVIDELVSYLGAVPCETREVAELEEMRAWDALVAMTESPPHDSQLRATALAYAAAYLRVRAVRW